MTNDLAVVMMIFHLLGHTYRLGSKTAFPGPSILTTLLLNSVVLLHECTEKCHQQCLPSSCWVMMFTNILNLPVLRTLSPRPLPLSTWIATTHVTVTTWYC